MNNLLVLRERFKQIYVSHSLLVRKGAQFLLALLVFNLINSNIGFMKMASSVLCTVGLAVVCTFLPLAVMTAAATVLIVAHLYTLSMPIAGVAVILFLLMYIFYFRFTPEKSWLILLTVVAFGMKIPLVIPVIFGLLGTIVWIVPASCGILVYYLLYLIKPGLLQNESFSSHMEVLWREAEMEGEEMTRVLTQFILTVLEIYYSQTFRRM